MVANIKDAQEGKFVYVRYVGPKPQKQVSWLEGKPIFNAANNFTCPVSFSESGKLIARCPEIFKVVSGPDEPLDRPAVIKAAEITSPSKTEEEKKEFKRGRKPSEQSSRLYGRADGDAFGSEISAKSQMARIAKQHGLKAEQMETVQTIEGWWLQLKPQEEDTGETDAELPDDMELTAASEGDAPQEE